MSRSRWSYGKIEDCEQSIIVSNGAFMWREWTLSYGSPKGTSVLTLNQSLFFSKIGVCFFFENRSLYFWKSEFVFFLKIGVCFLKTGVCSEKNRSYFLKIGVCSFQNRSMLFENPSIGPRFCAVILLLSSNKISGIARGGAGGSGPPLFFDQTEAQKNFLETVPLLISGSGWPPPLPLIWRSFKK